MPPAARRSDGEPDRQDENLCTVTAPHGCLVSSTATGAAAAPAPPKGPGPFTRLTGWLASRTPLSVWLGRRQDDYLRKLFGLFAEGDLDQALRHAIPLGKAKALGETE